MSLNCRSLRGKVVDLKILLEDHMVDIALLQETWLAGDLSIYAKLKEYGFKIVKLERTVKRGGGLAILIKETLTKNIFPCNNFQYKSFENTCCFLKIGKTNINLVNVYRPPNISRTNFINDFENLLTIVLEKEGRLVICGDFNIDWSSNDYTKREFSNLLDKYGLFQLVTKPTRENSIIDYIIVQAVDSNKSRIEDTEEKFPSDHKPLFVSVNILPFTPNNDIRCEKIRDYQLLDQDTFQDQIRQSKMADKSFFSDLNSLQCVNLYNTEMSNIINNLCPEQVRTFRRDQTKRWFTTDLTKLKRKKRQMERRMKKHKNSNRLKEEYSKIKNYYTKSVKQARVNFFSESIKKCEFDSKRLYKVLHSLTGKKTDKVFPDKENEHQTAEKMSDFFVEKVNNIRRNILEGNNSSNIINTKFEQTKSVTTSFNDFQKITLKTLKEIISSVKKKSCKLDPPTNDHLDEEY